MKIGEITMQTTITMHVTRTNETIFKFDTWETARSFIDRAVKQGWTVILGDDELYWVVTSSHATKLIAQR